MLDAAVIAASLCLARSDLGPKARPIPAETGRARAVSDLASILPARAKALLPASDHFQKAWRLPGEEIVSSAFVFSTPERAYAVWWAVNGVFGHVYRPRAAMVSLGGPQLTGFVIADALQELAFVQTGRVLWSVSVLDFRSATPGEREREFRRMLALAKLQHRRVGRG